MAKGEMVPILNGLEGLLRGKVELETQIGTIRRGTLTAIRRKEVRIGSSTAIIPTYVILDGDEADPIAVGELVRIGRA